MKATAARGEVNESNAYKFTDNFRIQTVSEPVDVIGCEHNEEEAKAIANWMAGEKGRKCVVIRNSPEAVRASKAFRKQPHRFEFRAMALKDMGVWR
jgi:predicted amino acid dehydrogenase